MGYHYDPEQALEELSEDVILPNPVHVRDMIFRAQLPAAEALEVDRDFEAYLTEHGELQRVVRRILERLVSRSPAR